MIPFLLYRFFTSTSTDFAIVVDCAPQEIPALTRSLEEQKIAIPDLSKIPDPFGLPDVFPFSSLRPSAGILSFLQGESYKLPQTGVVTITKRRTALWLIKRLSEIQISARCYRVPTLVDIKEPVRPGFGIRDN